MSGTIFKLKDDLSNLNEVLNTYQDQIEATLVFLQLEGVTLEDANRSQAYDYHRYAESMVELKTVVKMLEQNVERIKSKLWKQYTERHSIELSIRDKEQYIKSEPTFLDAQLLLIHAEELEEKFIQAVEAFKQRGFTLRNITNARVASVHEAVI